MVWPLHLGFWNIWSSPGGGGRLAFEALFMSPFPVPCSSKPPPPPVLLRRLAYAFLFTQSTLDLLLPLGGHLIILRASLQPPLAAGNP